MKKTTLFQFILLSLIISHVAFAQTKTISGLIIDGNTKTALKGANIYLLNKSLGTISDSEGYFTLEITQYNTNDTLVFSYLGYNEYKVDLRQLGKNEIIKLYSEILSSEDEVTVFADKINLARKELPHLSNTINAVQIENYGATEITDLFKMDPSVHIEGNDLDGKYMQIRGSDPDEVKIYVDGILLNTVGFNDEADLSIIPAENIEKIEIMKGANLMLLGNGAFGGVVNITSKNILHPQYNINMKYGSSQSKYISSSINVPISKMVFINYFGMWNEVFPEIEFFATERFTDKSTSNAISSIKQSHNLSFNYFLDKAQITTKMIGYLLNYSNAGWSDKKRNLLLASAFKGELFNLTELDLSIHYAFNTDVIKRNISNNSYYENKYISQRINVRGSKNFNLINEDNSIFDMQLLSEYHHDEVVADNLFFNNSAKTDLYDSYLYDNRGSIAAVLSFGNSTDSTKEFSWKAFAGMRGDFLANGDKYKTDNFGFRLNVNKRDWSLSPYISYGENIKFPSLFEFAFMTDIVDLSIGTNSTEPIILKPEYTASAEFGIKFSYEPISAIFNRLEIESSFFSTKVNNKIDERPISGFLIKTQLGENTLKGFEFSAKFLDIYSNINLKSAITVIDISNPKIYTYKPDIKFNINMDYHNYKGFYCSTNYFYEGKSVGLDYNQFNELQEEIISPFFDLDISAGYRLLFNKFKINFQISGYNILDNSGYKYYYLKKRFLQASIGVSY